MPLIVVVIMPNTESTKRLLRYALAGLGALLVGWWLFADTVRHHWPGLADAGPAIIRFAHFGNYRDYETWGRIIAAFEQRYFGSRVRQEYIVGWQGAYETKIRQQMLAGTLPQVVLMQLGPFVQMAGEPGDNGGFADLTELVDGPSLGLDRSSLAATGVQVFTRNGRILGLPVSGGNLLIYCNPDCFARAAEHRQKEIPFPDDDWTIEQFRELAGELTCDFDGDGRIDQFGFWQPRWIYYLPFLWSFGARVLDDSGRQWLLQGPQAEEALAFYRGLQLGDHSDGTSSPAKGGPVSPRPDQVAQMFQDVGFLTGKTAMCVNGPWFQPFLADTRLADRYRVAHIPIGPAGRVTRITWDGVCMADGLPLDQRMAAWKFIRFVCSQQAQKILAASGRALPALASAASSSAADGGGCGGKFVEALAYSRTQPITPFFRQLDHAINRHLARLLRGSKAISPGQCLSDLAADRDIVRHFDNIKGEHREHREHREQDSP